MSEAIPEDLKISCPACISGKKFSVSFQDPTKTVEKHCDLCKGKAWIWALDQEQMAERIAGLEYKLILWGNRMCELNEQLAEATKPVSEGEWNDTLYALENGDRGLANAIIAARKRAK